MEEVPEDIDAEAVLDALPDVIATRSSDVGPERREERRVWCEAGLFPAMRCFRIEQGVSLWPRPLPSSELSAEPLDVSARGMRVRTRAKNKKSPVLCVGDRIRLEFGPSKWNQSEIILESVVRFVRNDEGDESAALVGLEMINPVLNPQRRKMWSNWRMLLARTEREKLRRLRGL